VSQGPDEAASTRAPSKTVRNERRKLTASWLNTRATGMIAVGLSTRIATVLFGITAAKAEPWYTSVLSLIWA
jgi:hypothetical protein